MKIVRYGEPGRERAGCIDRAGQLRDLSAFAKDITPTTLDGDLLTRLARIDVDSLPVVEGDQPLGACVGQVRNFIAIGLNYADHAAESNAPIPAEPIIFNKAPSCISGPNDPIVIPRGSQKTDWEVELAIVIGKAASDVDPVDAMGVVAGYCVCNDVSEREYQLERGGTWTKGKGCPTFGPLGPWLVTKDEIPDPQTLSLWLDVNGERMQSGSTRTMIFDVRTIVSYVSRFMRLEPGDVITTGTPPGVGMAMSPPRYLKAGDVVTLGIDGLGEQRHDVVSGG